MKKELRDFQLKVVKKCINSNDDIDFIRNNRDVTYDAQHHAETRKKKKEGN